MCLISFLFDIDAVTLVKRCNDSLQSMQYTGSVTPVLAHKSAPASLEKNIQIPELTTSSDISVVKGVGPHSNLRKVKLDLPGAQVPVGNVNTNISFQNADHSKPLKSDVYCNNSGSQDKAVTKEYTIPDVHPLYHIVPKARPLYQWKNCSWPTPPPSFVFTSKVKCPDCPNRNDPGYLYDPQYKPLDNVPNLSDSFKQKLHKLLQVNC